MMGKHRKNFGLSRVENSRNQTNSRDQHDKLVEKLLEKCISLPKTWNEEYKDYKEICNLLREIQNIEQVKEPVLPNRGEHMDAFLDWCHQNGATNNKVTLKEMQPGNFGVTATDDIMENELYFTVPCRLMMSTQTANLSKLGPLIEKDPILQHMPSVVLSLHLLNEFASPNSFWKPYINILPSTYTTPLYFTPEEMDCLQASPAISESVKNCRSIARQYAYFYKMLQVNHDFKKLPLRNVFTFCMYRWAVSVVMTRQNHVPTGEGSDPILALVPLWDMCNHAEGKVKNVFCDLQNSVLFSTDVDLEKDQVNCYAMRDFQKDEEVCIFYGARTNAEFFVHNGFVYPENQYDAFPLKLGISKGDPLFAGKSQLCTKFGVQVCGDYFLKPGPLPIEDDLFNFAKIFSLDRETLQNCLENSNFDVLNDPASNVSSKALTFIENRLALLQCTYITSLEDDRELLMDPNLTDNMRIAICLRMLEKGLLRSAIVFLNGGQLPAE